MMTTRTNAGYRFFAQYIAITRHFNPKIGYDYFKYNGRCNVKPEHYEKRNDAYGFEKISRVIPEAQWQDYIVGNIMLNENGYYIRSLHSSFMDEWLGQLEKFPSTFREDCRYLAYHDLPELIKDDEPPLMIKLQIRKNISMETACLLNHILEFATDPKKFGCHKIIKYTPFLLQKIGQLPYYIDIAREELIERAPTLH